MLVHLGVNTGIETDRNFVMPALDFERNDPLVESVAGESLIDSIGPSPFLSGCLASLIP